MSSLPLPPSLAVRQQLWGSQTKKTAAVSVSLGDPLQIMEKCEEKYQAMIDNDPIPESGEREVAETERSKKGKKKNKVTHPLVDKFAKAFYKVCAFCSPRDSCAVCFIV